MDLPSFLRLSQAFASEYIFNENHVLGVRLTRSDTLERTTRGYFDLLWSETA